MNLRLVLCMCDFLKTCKDIALDPDGHTLSALCNPNDVRTAIDLYSVIENDDGQLKWKTEYSIRPAIGNILTMKQW